MSNKSLTSTNEIPDICLHLNGVSPAPRRDFFDLKVSLKQKKIFLVKWIITSRQEEGRLRPTEITESFEDFPSETINRYIPYVFGKDITRHIQGIIHGNYDWLNRLPDDLLVYLLTYVNLEDIERLSRVSARLRQVCTSDALWKALFYIHMPSLVSPEVESLGAENGWKSVFYSRIFERKLRAKHLIQSQSEGSTPRTVSAVSTRGGSATPRTPPASANHARPGEIEADDADSLASWRLTGPDYSEALELESVVDADQ